MRALLERPQKVIALRALLERPQGVIALMDSGTSFDDIAKIAAGDPNALGFVLDHTTGFQRLRSGNEAQGIFPVSVEELAHLGQGNGESLKLVLEHPDSVRSYMSRGVSFSAIAEIGCGAYRDNSMRALLERPQKVIALMDCGTSFDHIAQIAIDNHNELKRMLDNVRSEGRSRPRG